jgi:hypothetical protein
MLYLKRCFSGFLEILPDYFEFKIHDSLQKNGWMPAEQPFFNDLAKRMPKYEKSSGRTI